MRFLFLDRIDEFEPHERLVGSVTLPRTLAYPAGRPDHSGPAPSLMLEAMAQAGGWLIKASRDFRVLGIMSVVRNFSYQAPLPRSGTLRVEIRSGLSTKKLMTLGGTLSLPDDTPVAKVEAILYTLVPAEGIAYTWGKQAWSVLKDSRRLTIIEDVS